MLATTSVTDLKDSSFKLTYRNILGRVKLSLVVHEQNVRECSFADKVRRST